MSSQCLLSDEHRDALAVTFQKDGLNHQASLPQPQRRLVQQLLPGRQEARPHFFNIDPRPLEAVAVLHLLDDVQQDDGCAIQACQHRSVVERQIGSRTSVERNQDS